MQLATGKHAKREAGKQNPVQAQPKHVTSHKPNLRKESIGVKYNGILDHYLFYLANKQKVLFVSDPIL
jgi:hypothetical protein